MNHLAQAFNPNPPPARAPNVGMMVGWGLLVAMTGGVFYMTLRGEGVRRNRRVRRNSRQKTRVVREAALESAVTIGRSGAPKKVVESAKSLPEGLFRLSSSGDVIVYRDGEVTDGVLTSTRIAAAKSPSNQTWLVQVVRSRSGRRRIVPIRGYKKTKQGLRTVFRVEEA